AGAALALGAHPGPPADPVLGADRAQRAAAGDGEPILAQPLVAKLRDLDRQQDVGRLAEMIVEIDLDLEPHALHPPHSRGPTHERRGGAAPRFTGWSAPRCGAGPAAVSNCR